MIRKMRIILLGVTPIKYPDLPLAFVRSGYVRLNYGYAQYVGGSGGLWSRAANSSYYAYCLYFYTTGTNPSYDNTRYFGLPLRCLYPGSV